MDQSTNRFASSIASQLALVVLPTNGGILLLAGGPVLVTGGGPWLLMIVLGASALCLAGATWLVSQRLVSRPVIDLADAVRALGGAEDLSGSSH